MHRDGENKRQNGQNLFGQEMEEPSLLEAATSHVSAALDGAMAQFKAIFQEKLDSRAV